MRRIAECDGIGNFDALHCLLARNSIRELRTSSRDSQAREGCESKNQSGQSQLTASTNPARLACPSSTSTKPSPHPPQLNVSGFLKKLRVFSAVFRRIIAGQSNGMASPPFTLTALNRWSVANKQLPRKYCSTALCIEFDQCSCGKDQSPARLRLR
jgi:hypothetical protein